ncbi:hypothetical protein [Niabella aurantiaca]|nr:hypothetical protein [Niabella aurantiaca]
MKVVNFITSRNFFNDPGTAPGLEKPVKATGLSQTASENSL